MCLITRHDYSFEVKPDSVHIFATNALINVRDVYMT